MHKAYYNEHDPKAAAWLRELIKQGLIAPGDVDERSIEDVLPSELAGYTQCHFFAGIGVWSHALRQAGWPDDRPVWTGSCPCQPFSAAGKRGGVDDERHLWPAFYWLISQCKPDVVFGEQVASKDGLSWLDTVQADMEAAGYAIGAVDLCAASVGAPHIRQRLYFVADSGRQRVRAEGSRSTLSTARRVQREEGKRERVWDDVRECGTVGELADSANSDRWSGERREKAGVGPDGEWRRGSSGGSNAGILEHAASDGRDARRAESDRRGIASGCGTDILGDANDTRSQGWGLLTADRSGDSADQCAVRQAGPTNGFWRDAQWIYCRDDKYRAVEPGTFPLAHGAAARVGRLRGYGNAIVAPVAEAFIRAYLESQLKS